MICSNVIDEHGNPCGDEGRLCDACFEAEAQAHAYLRGTPRYTVMNDELARRELEQDLRDAGRGHLVWL